MHDIASELLLPDGDARRYVASYGCCSSRVTIKLYHVDVWV